MLLYQENRTGKGGALAGAEGGSWHRAQHLTSQGTGRRKHRLGTMRHDNQKEPATQATFVVGFPAHWDHPVHNLLVPTRSKHWSYEPVRITQQFARVRGDFDQRRHVCHRRNCPVLVQARLDRMHSPFRHCQFADPRPLRTLKVPSGSDTPFQMGANGAQAAADPTTSIVASAWEPVSGISIESALMNRAATVPRRPDPPRSPKRTPPLCARWTRRRGCG